MEEIEIPTSAHNWKFAVGFVIGVIVTLVIIVVLANKYGKEPSASGTPPPSDTGATAAPSEPQLALPPTAAPAAPTGADTETYMPAPF
jgi:hypothetical protein